MRKFLRLSSVFLTLFISNHCLVQAALAERHAPAQEHESHAPCHGSPGSHSDDDRGNAPDDCGGTILCCTSLVWASPGVTSVQAPARPDRLLVSLDVPLSTESPLFTIASDWPPPGLVGNDAASFLPGLRGPPSAGF